MLIGFGNFTRIWSRFTQFRTWIRTSQKNLVVICVKKKFCNKVILKKHMKGVHLRVCDVCGKVLKNPTTCDICNKGFIKTSEIRNHLSLITHQCAVKQMPLDAAVPIKCKWKFYRTTTCPRILLS